MSLHRTMDFFEDLAGENWTGDCAVFAFNSGINHNLYKVY